jgi:hypothetical protein
MMNRRNFTKMIGGLFKGCFVISCREDLPTTATIVKGKIIDDSGVPLQGAEITFYGYDARGFSGITTFHLRVQTDVKGLYSFSEVIPTKTDRVNISLISTDAVKITNMLTPAEYEPYLFKARKKQPTGTIIEIPKDKWGQVITVNFLYKRL